MKKYLFIIIAAIVMVGCENNGVEQNNELVGKAYNTFSMEKLGGFDRITFKTNSTAIFYVEFSDGYKSEKNVFYSFSDSTIVVGYDKKLIELLDTFIYHNSYLDRNGLIYYLEQ